MSGGLGGRPRVTIDRQDAIKLFKLWCTKEEMAGFFGISAKSMERICKDWAFELFQEDGGFDALRNHFGAETKLSLRRAQIKKAIQGEHPALLIWLGKQILGQRENTDEADSLDIQLSYSPDDL